MKGMRSFLQNGFVKKADHFATLSDYWADRVQRYGRRSVLNLSHAEREYDSVTLHQKQTLYPMFAKELVGNERRVLDFGCGPGRFTADLAEMIDGEAIGVDIVPELLKLAPSHPKTEYRLMDAGSSFPFADSFFDAAWICLVLGGLPEQELCRALVEMERVLKPGGLLFLVEGTPIKESIGHYTYRSESAYLELFRAFGLMVIGHYEDVGERISVFSGRRPVCAVAVG